MKKSFLIWIPLALVSVATRGNDYYREPFDHGLAVKQAVFSLGAGSWAVTSGYFRATFAATEPFAIPDRLTFVPSSGLFTGNLAAAGIEVVGFNFYAATEAPSHVYVELKSGTSVFQRVLSPPVPDTWTSYMVSLAGFSEGGWSVKRGSPEQFAQALTQVDALTINVQRSGASARECRVDNLFVDAFPEVVMTETSGGESGLVLMWTALQPGLAYRLQESPSPEGPWEDRGTVVVTSRLQHVSIPLDDADAVSFFRLRSP